MVTKNKHCYLHSKFFLLSPFAFYSATVEHLLCTTQGMTFTRQSKTNAGPTFNSFTVRWERETGHTFSLQDLRQLPEEMTETDLKKYVWSCREERKFRGGGPAICAQRKVMLRPDHRVSGGEGHSMRNKTGGVGWGARKVLPRSLDFVPWVTRKPPRVLSRGRWRDQIYVLASLFWPLGEECTGIGRGWAGPGDLSKIESTGLGVPLAVGGKGGVRDGFIAGAWEALVQDRKPIRKQEAEKWSALLKVT